MALGHPSDLVISFLSHSPTCSPPGPAGLDAGASLADKSLASRLCVWPEEPGPLSP